MKHITFTHSSALHVLTSFSLCGLLMLCLFPDPASAQGHRSTRKGHAHSPVLSNLYNGHQGGAVISDGKNGRAWNQWKGNAHERRVASVTAVVQRIGGGADTFINLRYGRDGHTFDGGKRIFLKDGRTHKVHWNVNESPHGRQLVMNAYKGTVRVISVEIRYH